MIIKDIKIKKFRSYDNLRLDFSPEINIIYGQNGMGKTNLVEAIYFLALTKSFRTNVDKNVIKKGELAALVEANVLTDYSTKYKLNINDEGKRLEVNNNKIDKISDYISRINVVLFNPLDTKIVNDSPSARRKMLNISISEVYKEYLIYLSNYEKVLKQRNSYIKTYGNTNKMNKYYLDVITDKLIEYGMKICEYRIDYISKLNEHIGKIYQNIFETGEIYIKYSGEFKNKSFDEIKSKFEDIYQKELIFGKTMIGIQHDDFDFILDGNKIKEWGSVGQIKNSIISYKLSEIMILFKEKGEYPILILDDLFSELDKKKISNILKMLNHNVQTFITTTEIDNVDVNNFDNYKIFHITNEKVLEEVNNE